MTTMVAASRNHEFTDMRRIGVRGVLLALPFLLAPLVEMFILPIDFFTFRVWEAALATPYRYPGPFYPNLHISKDNEFGDHYRSGNPDEVQAKPVEWFTDAYGWRNRPEIETRGKYDVVLLGDSNIVGSFLDQKDTVSEAIGARSGKTAYSYSIGSDHISLFFNDSRLSQKFPSLLVVESKVGNWITNSSYLSNFREAPDGSLDIVDRSEELKKYYSPTRKPFLEKIESRWSKQAMFHWAKASVASDFIVPKRNNSELFVGQVGMSRIEAKTWHPLNWIVSSGNFKPLSDEPQPALSMRATGPNTYWHTERFVANQPDGKIVVRFDAKNSVAPTRHRVWIFEDGSYHTVGEFVAGSVWRTFEIPISTNPGSKLEFQIDQPDNWQWLSIRDVQVIGGGQPPLVLQTANAIPMSSWTGGGTPCSEANDGGYDCLQWPIAGKNGYVQTPVLPQPGDGGILIQFEARTNKPASTFSAIYLFEGSQYRKVGQYAFGSEWREYTLLLQPDRSTPIKVQVDFPDSVELLAIRNFYATPAEQRH